VHAAGEASGALIVAGQTVWPSGVDATPGATRALGTSAVGQAATPEAGHGWAPSGNVSRTSPPRTTLHPDGDVPGGQPAFADELAALRAGLVAALATAMLAGSSAMAISASVVTRGRKAEMS
jgi:hypothetical protein